MRKFALILVCLLVAVSAWGISGASTAATTPTYDPTTVLAGFKAGTAQTKSQSIAQNVGAIELEVVGAGMHLLKVDPGTVMSTIDKLKTFSEVRYAEPNWIVHADLIPNDPGFSQTWGLKNNSKPGADIHAVDAWDVTTGTDEVVVGVIDTGVQYTHPDLAANIWSNPGGIGGCAAGTHGFNAITNSCDPMDDHFHGTHVSGTIGGVGNNGLGVAGVNWKTSIVGIKFLNSGGSGSTANAVKSVAWASDAKIAGINLRVLNNSWGGGGFSQALLDEINRAGDNDIMFVAAAGNNGSNIDTFPFYPASYKTTNEVVVAATTISDSKAGFSNWGPNTVDLGAPGENVYSTFLGGGYGSLSGTSMATPHVVGAIALILSMGYQNLADLKTTLANGVDQTAAMQSTVRWKGRLNVCRSLPGCVKTAMSADPAIADVDAGTVNLTFRATLAELESGSPLAGRSVTFSVGDADVCEATTDDTGTATCGTPVDAISSAPASGYDARFIGGGAYAASTAHGAAIHVAEMDLP